MHIQEFNGRLENSEYFKFIREKQALGRKFKKHSGLEKHHIYPKRFEDGEIGGDNLVILTVAEHFEAHLRLLTSLEALGFSDTSSSYVYARAAVNMMFKTRWEKLPEEERLGLENNIPDLTEIRNRTVHGPRSIEAREKSSKSMKGRVVHYQSEETRKKLSAISQARWADENYRQKQSKARRGSPKSQETIEKIRQANLRREYKKFSEEAKQHCREGHLGLIWVTNGVEDTTIKPDCLESYLKNGYRKGRSHMKLRKGTIPHAKGKKTVCNSEGKVKFVSESEIAKYIEQGWVPGRKYKII